MCYKDDISPTKLEGFYPVITNNESLLPRMGKTLQVAAVMQRCSCSLIFVVDCRIYSDRWCRLLKGVEIT